MTQWLQIMCVHAQSLQSCLSLCDPMDCSPPPHSRLLCPWDSPGKTKAHTLRPFFPSSEKKGWEKNVPFSLSSKPHALCAALSEELHVINKRWVTVFSSSDQEKSLSKHCSSSLPGGVPWFVPRSQFWSDSTMSVWGRAVRRSRTGLAENALF